MIRKIGWALAGLLLGLTMVKPLLAAPTFAREDLTAISYGAPQSVVQTSDGFRMYFISAYSIYSATSSDGVSWTTETGSRLSFANVMVLDQTMAPITGCSVQPLSDGGWGMIFSVGIFDGPFGIFRSTSSNGLDWATSFSTAVYIATGTTFTSSPRVVIRPDGDWKLFYVQDKNSGGALDAGLNNGSRAVYTSDSSDEGITWSTTTLILDEPVGEIAVSTRPEGAELQRIRLYYTSTLTGQTTNTVLLSALSNTSATRFTEESGVRLSTSISSGYIANPVVVRSTDTYRYRLYYNFDPYDSIFPPSIYMALTTHPDPQSLTPNQVYASDPASTFTIRGEIFSSTPTVKLTLAGGGEIPGTGVIRLDDQTIMATFDTQAKAIGIWALIVTNENGASGTLQGALDLTFSPGYVTLTDNLLRPRLGLPTQIDVTIFVPGDVESKLYTMDGRLVKTIYDGEMASGTTNLTWDGKTPEGQTVASGVYVLITEGPKLNAKQKIVVIR